MTTASGGTNAGGAGGASTGGTTASGGATATGGTTATGGAIATGGTTATGGANAGGGGMGGSRPALLSSTTANHDFGGVEIGVASAAFDWSISNTGDLPTGPLTLQSSAAAETVLSNGCASGLGAAATCTVSVAFRASQAGARAATVVLMSTSGVALNLMVSARGKYRVTVSIVGTGTGAVTVNPGNVVCTTSCSQLLDPGPVEFHAKTTNGSDSYFAGWTGFCSDTARDCLQQLAGPQTVSARFSAMTANLIFMTSASFATNLGSATAYDAKCNQVASAAGINNAAGTGYTAMVSDAASLAKNRLGTARGWVRMDGAPFADTQASLFSDARVFNSIRYDELGKTWTEHLAMTGSAPDGSLSIFTCSNWTTSESGGGAASQVMLGTLNGGPTMWMTGQSTFCSLGFSLVCMGRTRDQAVTPEASVGKKIWQSTGVYPGNQTPDALCQSSRPVGVASAVAFISRIGVAASSVLSPTALYVRPDGTAVGTGLELTAGHVRSGIWQLGTGDYAAGVVWTGSATPGDAGTEATTCNGWTNTTGTAISGLSPDDGTIWWKWGGGPWPCSDLRVVYCVEP